MTLSILSAYDHLSEIEALFSEYTDMLVAGDATFREYLVLQNYDAELKDPAAKYGPPKGRLYLARLGEETVGCIALKPLDEHRCELKRLYVRPAYRRHGIAKQLVQRILADAKEIGYSAMLLDTLPFLREAIALYQQLGFYETEPYLVSPMTHAIYLRRDL